MEGLLMGAYLDTFSRALQTPEAFWSEQAGLIDWVVRPTKILDSSEAPMYRWFPDGVLNTCFNALDRHVLAGRGEHVAIRYDSPVTGAKRSVTYSRLLTEVAALAGGLRDLGVVAGDRVIVYMPMVPEAVVAMLAVARLGAVHCVVFGGFAPKELASRIDDATPRAIITASCGVEPTRVIDYVSMVDEALRLASHKIESVVMLQRPEHPGSLVSREAHDWADVLATGADDPAEPHPCRATDPLYVLYTSGTTGGPKGVVRDNGGHAVALAWSFRNVFGMDSDSVWWSASDIGWVVGHSYIVYAPLICGATTVLYEGKPVGTPDAGAFWRVIEEHGVEGLLTAPTAIRAIKKEDPEGLHRSRANLSTLQSLFLAGERLDPDTQRWASELLDVPVIDHWWQTETGWPIAANLRGLEPMPIKPGSPTVPVPGFDLRVLDGQGAEVAAGVEGALCLRLPLPPGSLTTIWNDQERYRTSYLNAFDGYYLSGDGGHIDADGYVFVMGRTDDVINVAGHRLSTGSIEAVFADHPLVAESAVIGAADPLKGQVPRGFIVVKAGVTEAQSAALEGELIAMVRSAIGAIAAPQNVTVVEALPKTRSGKILRRSMREIADTGETAMPPTIEDAGVLERLRPALRRQVAAGRKASKA
jgi:propionyl-CoA synthetase